VPGEAVISPTRVPAAKVVDALRPITSESASSGALSGSTRPAPNVMMGVVGILVPLSVQDGRAERRLAE
jgi:hypothetical protein